MIWRTTSEPDALLPENRITSKYPNSSMNTILSSQKKAVSTHLGISGLINQFFNLINKIYYNFQLITFPNMSLEYSFPLSNVK